MTKNTKKRRAHLKGACGNALVDARGETQDLGRQSPSGANKMLDCADLDRKTQIHDLDGITRTRRIVNTVACSKKANCVARCKTKLRDTLDVCRGDRTTLAYDLVEGNLIGNTTNNNCCRTVTHKL